VVLMVPMVMAECCARATISVLLLLLLLVLLMLLAKVLVMLMMMMLLMLLMLIIKTRSVRSRCQSFHNENSHIASLSPLGWDMHVRV
jgi:hypothetical protein